MEVYLTALNRKLDPRAPRRGRQRAPERPAPLAFPELRSRLSLVATGPREVVASWALRPDDWQLALEWLGPDAPRAVLTVRLFDVTGIRFSGNNAHSIWDVDVGLAESFHVIGLRHAGRSLAACLGARTQWGYFHPIAFARICHLPREELAGPAPGPIRRLSVMPRRG
jgi:hypothetical protein